MITSVRWVPVGAARERPIREDIDAEMAVTEQLLQQQQEQEIVDQPQIADTPQIADEPENADEPQDMDEDDDVEPLLQVGADLEFEDNADDPYIDQNYQSDSSDEDVAVKQGDQLILAAHTEDEQASLSVYLYNDELEQLYVHHDMMLPDMPLCTEWIGVAPRTREAGNWAAVGTLSPEIELWNLDILNATNPHALLNAGKEETKKSKKKNKKNKNKIGELGGHSAAVLGLAWNRNQSNVLASASADCSARLWDLETLKCSAMLAHRAKVQSVVWNPLVATVLATGSFDKTCRVADVRDFASAALINLNADAECLRWVPGSNNLLVVSTEVGEVHLFDVAQIAKGPVWSVKAHDKACTGVAMTSKLPGLLITVSLDKSLKIWNVRSGKPSLVCAKANQFGSGALFGVEISDATPFVCVIACEGENLQIFDFKSAIAGGFQ